MNNHVHLCSLRELFLEREMSQKKVVEEIKTYILCSITFFFRKPCRLWDNVEKICRFRQATVDNKITVNAHCMLD